MSLLESRKQRYIILIAMKNIKYVPVSGEEPSYLCVTVTSCVEEEKRGWGVDRLTMANTSDNWTAVDVQSTELTGMDAFCRGEFIVSRLTCSSVCWRTLSLLLMSRYQTTGIIYIHNYRHEWVSETLYTRISVHIKHSVFTASNEHMPYIIQLHIMSIQPANKAAEHLISSYD